MVVQQVMFERRYISFIGSSVTWWEVSVMALGLLAA